MLGSTLLGTIGVFVHYANAGVLAATWYRCAFGLLGLTIWLSFRRQLGALRLDMRSGPWVVLAGLLLVASWALFFGAIGRVSTGVAVVLFQVQPMWVLLLGAFWLKEPIGGQRLASVGVALVGLLLATGVLEHTFLFGDATTSGGLGYWLGVVFCLVGAFLTACVTVITKRLGARPAGVVAWWQCLVGSLILWPWTAEQGWQLWASSWPWLAGLGLIHTGLTYTLMYAGMPHLSAGRIAILQFVYPAAAIFIDWLYFERQLGVLQLVGVAIMAVAIGVSEFRPRQSSAHRGSLKSR